MELALPFLAGVNIGKRGQRKLMISGGGWGEPRLV